jgi:hypothetical protein
MVILRFLRLPCQALGLAGLQLALLTGCATDDTAAIRIGTSSVGSTFYGLAVAISELIQDHAAINSTVEPVGGSVPNVFALDANRIDFALVNAFASFSGFHGINEFPRPVDIRLVMQGQMSFRHLLVRTEARIDSPMDLVGKTIVAERPANPDLILIMNELIKSYGLPRDEIQIVSTTTTSEVMRALRVGSVDGALLPFGESSPIVEQALSDGLVEFLDIPLAKRDEILQGLPAAIQGGTIAGGAFSHQPQDVPTFAMSAYLVTREDMSEETVCRILAVLLENNEEFRTYQAMAREWTAERTLSDTQLPFHQGAIRYFKERDLWTDQLETRQRALLNGT